MQLERAFVVKPLYEQPPRLRFEEKVNSIDPAGQGSSQARVYPLNHGDVRKDTYQFGVLAAEYLMQDVVEHLHFGLDHRQATARLRPLRPPDDSSQPDAGGPPVGSVRQKLDLVGRHRWQEPRTQLNGFVVCEPELGVVELTQLAPGAQPAEGEPRLPPRQQDHMEPIGQVLHELGQRPGDRLIVVHQVDIIDDEHHVRSGSGI